MKKVYSGKLVWLHALLFGVFYMIFRGLGPCYLKANCGAVDHAIDVDLMRSHIFFHTSYVTAARGCYNVRGYFTSFFPLDMLFPIVYSLLYLSVVEWTHVVRGRKILLYMILVGAVLDYLEDFTFATYLLNGTPALAGLTAVFTTFKTCLFALNMVCCLLLVVQCLLKKALGRPC